MSETQADALTIDRDASKLVNFTGYPIVTSHETIYPLDDGVLASVREHTDAVDVLHCRTLGFTSYSDLSFGEIKEYTAAMPWHQFSQYDYLIVQGSVLDSIPEDDLLEPFPLGPNRRPQWAIKWYMVLMAPKVELEDSMYRTDQFRRRWLGRSVPPKGP